MPKTPEMSALYKAIIESSKLSKMGEKETLVRVKSSTNISDAEKIVYLKENINKIPLNELIRNLRFITANCNFSTETELKIKVLNRLNSIEDFRFLNIFDLIETSKQVPQLESVLFEVINGFVAKVKTKFSFENQNGVVLFDVSGSMSGKGLEDGFKYLVLMSLLFDKVDLALFNTDLLLNSKYNTTIEYIKKGRLSDAYKYLVSIFASGGTAVVESTRKLITSNPGIKNLVIISDEVSWSEGSDLTYSIKELDNLLKETKTILVNPVVSKGTVFGNNIVAMSSLTTAVIYNIMISMNQLGFIKYIKNYKGNTEALE
jgi:hypothetical protein